MFLLIPSSAPGGVYNPAERPLGPADSGTPIQALPYSQFKSQLTDVLNARFPIETTIRKQYEERRRALEATQKSGNATTEDSVSLSAYLMYLGEPGQAVEILTPLAARDRGNYIVTANLMTAHQLVGEMERAASLVPLLRGIKPNLAKATPEQRDWYARVDSFHQKLVNDRYREGLRRGGGRPVPPETVDDLFGVKFLGANGTYVAGEIAPEEKAKLPADAIAVVQQLLLSMPDDTRLYWLLGELYNAHGDIRTAAAVFDDCRRESTRRLDAAELRDHRQIVHEAVANLPKGIPLDWDWLPSWDKLIFVGGIGAALITLFAYFQIREWRRRSASH